MSNKKINSRQLMIEDLGDDPIRKIIYNMRRRYLKIKVIINSTNASDINYGRGYIIIASNTKNEIIKEILENVKNKFSMNGGYGNTSNILYSPKNEYNLLNLNYHLYYLNPIYLHPRYYENGGIELMKRIVYESIKDVIEKYEGMSISNDYENYENCHNNDRTFCKDFIIGTNNLEDDKYPIIYEQGLTRTSKRFRSLKPESYSSFGKVKVLKKLQREAKRKNVRITKKVNGKRKYLGIKELRKKLKGCKNK